MEFKKFLKMCILYSKNQIDYYIRTMYIGMIYISDLRSVKYLNGDEKKGDYHIMDSETKFIIVVPNLTTDDISSIEI